MAVPLDRHVVVPTLQSLVDDATGQIPALARLLAEALHDELRSRPHLLPIQDAWRRLRPRFVDDFKAIMLPLMRLAREGRDPLQPAAAALSLADELSAGLSLVDEQQAMQDVALSKVVRAVEAASDGALLQLGNCFAALRGTAKARANDNPLRPAVFVQGLLRTLSGADLPPAGRNLLIEAAAQPMAMALSRLYATLCQQLQDADLSRLLVHHGVARTRPDMETQRFLDSGASDQLGALHARDQQRGREAGEPDLLARLYRQILADPRLLPSVKSLISRLQMPVMRLARRDAALLTDQQHPAWQLLNSLAANGMAFDQDSEPRLLAFVRHMQAELQPLIDTPMPTRAHFVESVKYLDRYIGESARRRDERGAAALAALEREEQRGAWLAVVSDQIVAQTSRAPLGAKVRSFLRLQWAEVIVQAMVLQGRDGPDAQAWMELVDTLLDSLQPAATEADRQALRSGLPNLINRLRQGAASIALPESRLEPALQELMEQHGRVLRGLPALVELPAPTEPPVPPNPQAGDSTLPPETDPGLRLRRLIDETPSQLPTIWATADVDRASLPTVPVQLYGNPESKRGRAAFREWIDGQRAGTWYHLFVQGNWMTAQLAWIAENRGYFHFVGQDSEERHSLTRGALERLLPAGLIAVLGADGIVERAVDSLMQNLPDAKA